MEAAKPIGEPRVGLALTLLAERLAECDAGARDFFAFAKAWARFFMIASDLNEVIVAWAQLRRWTEKQAAGPGAERRSQSPSPDANGSPRR
jgi:hypothetical protein